MKQIKKIFLVGNLYVIACSLSAQPTPGYNVGIGAAATSRARLEVSGVSGEGSTSAIFGSESSGISFQRNSPAIGYNQYRRSQIGYGTNISNGYAAIQHINTATGAMAIEMLPVTGFAGSDIFDEFYRAMTIFPNGSVSFGKGQVNAALMVDYLNTKTGNLSYGSAYFYGTQWPSFLNLHIDKGTQIGPGKTGGTTFINDIPGGNVVMGINASQVSINTDPLYLATLSVRHAANGFGLLLIEESSFNNWEWYLSTNEPAYLSLNYNGNLVADISPSDGHYSYISDKRLKTNVHALPPLIDKIMKLKPVNYQMKENRNTPQYFRGFIAQDVKSVFPELVSEAADNSHGNKGIRDLQMLSYSQFFVLAIKAIQEQQKQIAVLKTELEFLEASQ